MKHADGELRTTSEGLVARITIKGRHRESVLLWGDREQAKARRKLVAGVATSFRRAGVIERPEAVKLLHTIGAAVPAMLEGALTVASELAGGELVRDDKAKVPTFTKLGK